MNSKMRAVITLFAVLAMLALQGCQLRDRNAATILPTQTPAAAVVPIPSDTFPPPTVPVATTPASSPTAVLPTEPLSTPTVDSNMDLKLGIHAPNAVGKKNYVVVLVDFPDVERRLPENIITERLLTRLSSYLDEASYHKLNFQGTMTKRYLLPNPVAYYKISPANLEVDRSKVVSLVKDALNAADADVNFSKDLFVILLLGATPQEYGMIGYCALPGMLGFMDNQPIVTNSGEEITNIAVFCENAHPGTHVHDTLHMLGGIVDDRRMTPCLYDQDLQAQFADSRDLGEIAISMGYWDPLSSHVPYNRELPPTGLSSWTKLRLGWIDPDKIALVKPGETVAIRLDPLELADATTHVIKIPISATTYYLVENRQPIESDVNLPSSGVLILYANDSILECRRGESPVKIIDADPSIKYFMNAAYDINKKSVFMDVENNIAILLQNKEGQSYNILVTTPDKAVNK